MACNAAGIDVAGSANPNWKGGRVRKECAVCGASYSVKRANASSRFCSLKCVGVSQRKPSPEWAMAEKMCLVCSAPFSVPLSHSKRLNCCSRACGGAWRSRHLAGERNPNWAGGASRLPYVWNFAAISKGVIARDGAQCQNPNCRGTDPRMTTHHIDYDKQNNFQSNLIALCSACNSKANFGRDYWQHFYAELIKRKKAGGGWIREEF